LSLPVGRLQGQTHALNPKGVTFFLGQVLQRSQEGMTKLPAVCDVDRLVEAREKPSVEGARDAEVGRIDLVGRMVREDRVKQLGYAQRVECLSKGRWPSVRLTRPDICPDLRRTASVRDTSLLRLVGVAGTLDVISSLELSESGSAVGWRAGLVRRDCSEPADFSQSRTSEAFPLELELTESAEGR